MVKVDFYTASGTKKGSFALPKIYGEKINLGLLAQAIRVYEDRTHPGLAKVKTRGEVALSTRKIYRQKGTGGARHGAKSAPIFVGGGVAHGPKGIKRQLALPAKMRRKALNAALSLKAKNGKLAVVDSLSTLKKTKDVNALVDKLKGGQNIKFTFVLGNGGGEAVLAIRNIENVYVETYSNLNAYKVYKTGIVLMDRQIFSKEKNTAKKKVAAKKVKKQSKSK